MVKEVVRPDEWDYETSVVKAKDKFQKWHKVTLELVKELHDARTRLANPGYRSDLTSGHNGPRLHTWEGYLSAVGIPLTTAKRWLFLYDAEKNLILEPEEARARRDQMLEQMFRQIQAHAKKDPSWRPEDWTAPFERAYQKWLGELKTLNAIEQKGFEQAELFSREYLRIIAQQMQEDPSPEEMLYQEELCIKYEKVVTPMVRVEQQISIARIVEKSIAMFPAEARSAVARSVAKIVMDMSDHMEGEK